MHGSAPLADAELRRRLERQQGDGVLTIWKGAPPATSSPTPAATRRAAFSGQVDGAAPVQSIVDIVDMLADIVDDLDACWRFSQPQRVPNLPP